MSLPSTARRRVWLAGQTAGKAWTMRPHYERRPAQPRVRDPETYHRPAPGTMRQNEEAKAMQTRRAQRLDGTDHWGRTWADRRAWTRFLRGFVLVMLVAIPAEAACPAHQQVITATPEGTFHLCPLEVDGSTPPVPVTVGYYRQCDVTILWSGSGTTVVSVMNPTPGVSVVISVPAATGRGGATAHCTNRDGVEGPISAASITFRKPYLPPAPPVIVP